MASSSSPFETNPTKKPEPAVALTEVVVVHRPPPEPMSSDDVDVDLEKGTTSRRRPSQSSEFDPCFNARFTSPFYDHDTPRLSSDGVVKNNKAGVAAVAAAAATTTATTTTTAAPLYTLPTQNSSTSTLKNKTKKKQPCMTKPRQGSRWWAAMSPKQKLVCKLLLAIILVGAIVGLAVGITKRVGGGVVKSDGQVSGIS
jgi:hypothetical protein